MEIIIGRDQTTRKLRVVKDGKAQLYGMPNSVPMDVSRNHVSFQQLASGKWIVKNINSQNVTYVNGIAVESKTVSQNDKIELGASHYLFQWEALREPKIETVDIRPLRQVWDEYNEGNINIRIRQKNNGLLASLPIGFTMLGGIVASMVADEYKPYAYIFTVVAFLVMVYGLFRRFTDDSINEQETVKKEFQRKYICPKCGHFLGYQDYDILVQSDACPYCKTKFKK